MTRNVIVSWNMTQCTLSRMHRSPKKRVSKFSTEISSETSAKYYSSTSPYLQRDGTCHCHIDSTYILIVAAQFRTYDGLVKALSRCLYLILLNENYKTYFCVAIFCVLRNALSADGILLLFCQ
jgi:hypothetical protein